MPQERPLGDQILEVVRANPDCTLEEVTQQLPGLYWSDVFLEVKRLSRARQLRLIHNSLLFTTTLRLP